MDQEATVHGDRNIAQTIQYTKNGHGTPTASSTSSNSTSNFVEKRGEKHILDRKSDFSVHRARQWDHAEIVKLLQRSSPSIWT